MNSYDISMELGKEQLERKEGAKRKPAAAQPLQLPIFGQGSAIEEEVRSLDIDSMSPIEAINKLYELKKKAGMGARMTYSYIESYNIY